MRGSRGGYGLIPLAVMLSILAAGAPARAQAPGGADGEESGWRLDWTPVPELTSNDGRFSFKFRGRLMYDLAFIDEDEALTGYDEVSDGRWRSARIGVDGVLFDAWDYTVELDFAGGDVVLADLLMSVGSDRFKMTVGHQKPPVSLEELASLRIITFLERGSVTDAFTLFRQTGITLFYAGDGWTMAGGLYGPSPNPGAVDDGFTYAGRATVAPRIAGGLVHLGVSYRHRDAKGNRPTFDYRQRPHLAEADRFVGIAVGATGDELVGLELAAIFGPFAMESEYIHLKAEVEGDNPEFDGFFISGSWFITGESRRYENGEFDRVKVARPVFKGGMGAVELAARFDTINLTDAGFEGGEQDSYIIGANWHMTDYLRLMANYNYSHVDGGLNDGADIHGLGLRAQLDW